LCFEKNSPKFIVVKSKKNISVFDYIDYRQYLAEYYIEQKEKKPVFSYRYFAKKAGYNSSGMYKDIVSGRTNIKPGFITKLSKAIKHGKREEEFFEYLVNFNQSKNQEEKSKYFERMMRFHNSTAFVVESKNYEFYSNWYYTAIRDLLNLFNFKEDYAGLANFLDPRIRPDQAKKAVSFLLKHGMIKKNTKGYLKPVNKIITTGSKIKLLNIKNFQLQMMDLAKESLNKHSAKERNISTVSFGVSEKTYQSIESEINICRKRILTLVEKSENENRLYQLNFQLFPLSKIKT